MKTELSPKTIAIVIGVLVVLVGGFFFVQSRNGPNMLKATGAAATDTTGNGPGTTVDPFSSKPGPKGD